MKKSTIITLIIVLVIFSALLLITNYNKQIVASESQENLEINLSDFKVCCSYLDEAGNEKSCVIKERFDCSICKEKCPNIS